MEPGEKEGRDYCEEREGKSGLLCAEGNGKEGGKPGLLREAAGNQAGRESGIPEGDGKRGWVAEESRVRRKAGSLREPGSLRGAGMGSL